MLNVDARFAQLEHQIAKVLNGFYERCDLRQLTADMTVDTHGLKMRGALRVPVEILGLLRVDAELIFFKPRRDVRVRFRIDIGVDADRNTGDFTALTRDFFYEVKLAL